MARSVGNNDAFAREESARSARNYGAIARKESVGSARNNGAIARKELARSARNYGAMAREESTGSARNNGAIAREESTRSARDYGAIAREESAGSARNYGAMAREESAGSARNYGAMAREESRTSESDGSRVGNKKGRGATRNLKLAKLFTKERFPIIWKKGRPVGKYSKVFKSECTALVRRISLVPLQVKDWREERFIVEGQETLVWKQMNRSYKNYRSSLKKKWFKPYEEDPEEALEILPPNMVDDDWNYLVNLWSNKDWKTMCDKNKYSRSKNFIIHITGSKSFQQRSEEERERTGEDPSRLQLFEITHTRSNGQAANETTQEALMKFKRLTTEVAEGSLQMSGDEMFVEVFGPEHHGRVRGYGDGISPTELWGSSSSTIRDLQMQLKESEERRKENDANLLRKLKESEEHRKESDTNVQLLKEQVNRVESLLAQVLKNIAPFELAQSDCSS
ncbi:hypothetical protein SO802_011521 [Lithocarpus litseifolius]|uniref:Transposase, Ptta/En/Spm, plant n=1 Tax=Lithocarpus litseifolius TaxID=425828 RepID=A0AAW2D084_9ROSI